MTFRRSSPAVSPLSRRIASWRGKTMGAGLALMLASGTAPGAGPVKTDDVVEVQSLAGAYLAGRFAGQSRDIGASASYFEAALALDPGNQVLEERAFQLLVAGGRIAEAVPLAERLVRRTPGHILGRLVLGSDAMKKGRWEKARKEFAAIPSRPVSDLTVGVLSAWAIAGSGDTSGALKAIDKINGVDWYAVFKNYHAYLIADRADRTAEATKRIEAALKSDPAAQRIVEGAVRNMARTGRTQEALAALADFDKQMPDHPLMVALRQEIEAGRKPGPVVASPQAGAAEFLYGIGTIMARDGGEDIASMYLQLATWIDPKAELPIVSLATLVGQSKRWEDAMAILARIPETSKIRPLADILIGRYHTMEQNYGEASKHLEAVIARSPKDMEAIVSLGDVLRSDKKYAEAAKVYTRAIELIEKPSKGDWTYYYFRGICFERTKEWPKAEADFDKALSLMPDEPHVLNYLGYSWIDMGINLEKGLALVKKAVELKSDDGYIVDSLGWAYFKLGRFEEAVTELEKAILLKPDDPVINDHLGDAYWKVGRQLEATFQWRHSLNMKPEAEEIPKIEAKLKKGLVEEAGTPVKTGEATPPAPATTGEAALKPQ